MAALDFISKAVAVSHCSFSGSDTSSEYPPSSWIEVTETWVQASPYQLGGFLVRTDFSAGISVECKIIAFTSTLSSSVAFTESAVSPSIGAVGLLLVAIVFCRSISMHPTVCKAPGFVKTHCQP